MYGGIVIEASNVFQELRLGDVFRVVLYSASDVGL